jgi:hypothetical protein
MIKGLTGGAGIAASGGMTYPYIPMNPNNPIQGMLRISGQDIQTFDGSGWVTIGASYANVSLDSDSLDLLQWARTERAKHAVREERIRNNPALRKAFEAIQRAEDNFDILDKIVGDDLDAELRELAP